MAAPNFWQNIKKQEETFVKKKSLYQYIAPNILAMVGISCYILADTFFYCNSTGYKWYYCTKSGTANLWYYFCDWFHDWNRFCYSLRIGKGD